MSKKFEIVAYEDATPQFYKEIGFKAGLEVHQQLDTEKKLFCRCPAGLYSEEHDAAIIRHMRPTLSEMGTYDGTALMEFKKQKEVLYLLKDESVCTYEMDDTPPFLINEQALEYAIKIAQMFGCEIVGEVHIMRKQYLDGSIPTGFQRTAIIGLDGEIPLSDGRVVRVTQLNLEEDACREVSDIGHRITFRTDRLSMPLIEVITDSSIDSPQMAYEVARRIQALTRASGLVRRGIGASRQDVNGSVAGGSRVEIKGVPRIPMIPKLLHYEAVRQKIFLELKDEIARRGILGADSISFVELTANPTVLKIPIFARAERVIGVLVRDFEDLFTVPIQPGRTFADDVSSIVRVVACMDQTPNIIYSPRPDVGGPDETQWRKLRSDVGARDGDLLVLVWGNHRDTEIAAGEVRDRIMAAKDVGVPNETRKAHTDGTTEFERVLPGPDRMYPDTDHPPIPLEGEYIEQLRAQLPDSPWDRERRWRNLGLSWQLIFDLIHERRGDLFDDLVDRTTFRPTVLAVAITQVPKHLVRAFGETAKENLSEEKIFALFAALNDIGAPQEALWDATRMLALGEEPEKIAANFKPLAEEEVAEKVAEIYNSRRGEIKSAEMEAKVRAVMGFAMRELRGKVPGDKLYRIVAKMVKNG